jgi:hypothetical protein
VEEDATSFKPFGEMIYSYTRPDPAAAEKGKGKAAELPREGLDPQSVDAVEYEVWHVRFHTPHHLVYYFLMPFWLISLLRRHGIPLGSKSTIEECKYSFYSTLKRDHTLARKRTSGNLLFCESSLFINTREVLNNIQIRKTEKKGRP